MTKLGIMTIASGLLGAVALVALPTGGLLSEATAAKNPAKASARCRKMIGKSTVKVVTQGLKTIERCHAQRLKRDGSGDCNSLQGDTFARAKTQALARLNLACKEGDPVAENYGTPIVSSGFDRVLAAIQRNLEESGTALSASPVFQGDAQTVKALKKCHGAVGKGRTSVVQGVVKGATKCQQKVDKGAQAFGPLDPSCLVGAGGTGGKASGKIGKACGSFSGVEVGSCAALPGCLVSAGESAGQRIARLAYGGPAVCGNGLVDLVEECDDGNTVEDDGCTSTCKLPVCGDGVVNDPSEECEDAIGRDDPSQNCFECKVNVCGDGHRDTQEPGIEECDDGNAVGGDGCTDCTVDPTLCSATGVAVTIALDYPEGLLGGVSATRIEMSYPAYVSIPGSLFAGSVRQRVTSLLPDNFSFQGSDRDANGDTVDDFVRVEARTDLGNIDPGDLARVQFDCAAGTPVFPTDFPCTIPELVDPSGNPFANELKAEARCVLTFEGDGAVPTTTTTTTTPPITGTTTTVTVSTTTTTRPATCGNGETEAGEECDDDNDDPNDGCTNFCTICGNDIVTAPESCDDNNTDVNDNCPEDCRIEACVPSANPVQTITVTASRADLSSIRFLLDYPDGRVALGGGAGPDVPPGTIFDTPDGTDVTVFDLEHAVRILVGAPFAFETATIARVELLGCSGSNPPVAGDYRCIVIDAADGNFVNVPGVTCSVSVN